jgi:hypothetical protein
MPAHPLGRNSAAAWSPSPPGGGRNSATPPSAFVATPLARRGNLRGLKYSAPEVTRPCHHHRDDDDDDDAIRQGEQPFGANHPPCFGKGSCHLAPARRISSPPTGRERYGSVPARSLLGDADDPCSVLLAIFAIASCHCACSVCVAACSCMCLRPGK